MNRLRIAHQTQRLPSALLESDTERRGKNDLLIAIATYMLNEKRPQTAAGLSGCVVALSLAWWLGASWRR